MNLRIVTSILVLGFASILFAGCMGGGDDADKSVLASFDGEVFVGGEIIYTPNGCMIYGKSRTGGTSYSNGFALHVSNLEDCKFLEQKFKLLEK